MSARYPSAVAMSGKPAIAEGRFDEQKLFDIWMHSAPHRRNMLDPRFTRLCLAYVPDGRHPNLRYWSLVLGQ